MAASSSWYFESEGEAACVSIQIAVPPSFVAVAIAQDLRNRNAFDNAQIGRILAESAGA